MTQRNSDVTITRSAVGQLLGLIAGVALLSGFVALLWQQRFSGVVIGAGIVAVAGVAGWAFLSPSSLRSFITGRRARNSGSSVLGGLLMLGIVSLMYIIIARANLAGDLTAEQDFSLSDQTFELLSEVTRPVQITGFYTNRNVRRLALDSQFFQLYEQQTDGLVTVEYINPDVEPAVAQRFGVTQDGEVFVSFLNPDGSIDFSRTLPVTRGNRQERDISNAIARLRVERLFTVYFDRSPGSLDPVDTTPNGMSTFNGSLQINGMATQPLSLADLAARGQPVPDDAAALVLARPANALPQAHIDLIDAYLRTGGGLIVFADALFNDDPFLAQDSAFNQFLASRYGLSVQDAIVVDEGSSVQSPLDVLAAVTFQEPPVGENLPEAPILFRVARPVFASADKPATVANGRILATSPRSWGERDVDAVSATNSYDFDRDVDIAAPLTLAAWAWDEGGDDSKVVVIGDSDFATNGVVDAGADGNAALFVESVEWASDFATNLLFTPQPNISGQPLVFISTATLDIIGLITIVLLPGSVLVAGIAIWWWRSRRR